ncbi:peptide-methionine (S)-S-oxide reductase MsrA [Liquorilactobacillus satsumensis]|uniref:peptide-methionine (S)-S-oxide reductase MsrA n=1 Tax=Liquorilactobacillus satsumensis TaxID=259059 RepID=UPI001E5EBF64|nr:peptide-methionine (S)-S-oxide reductase MsrA [Liquorilactobacillus satsumensis]MCC7666325.1 peptide-methionine (S)-S-oxide reductase [Liquorilactobacillus satsumensis]MCP9358465.1 peptide-methionine (S)-S-oxide reductase MsrA [Liquorilactobacillus satsumensis]MCP9372419.1 peptide-methionine (S)-S-oxide reductase MsrA [Liquorilactobacillus satsumensis]
MEKQEKEMLADLYNLILNPATRKWERSLLVETKEQLSNQDKPERELAQLEYKLRPLAIRNNLTPDVADFYAKLTGNAAKARHFDLTKHAAKDPAFQERAIFAGGCFWCMVEPFETRRGIISVLSGYTGGTLKKPTYEQVVSGTSGHVEAVEIIFDTRIISYAELVELYWKITDPTDALGQFEDRGSNYRPVIFVKDETQRKIATESKQRLAASGRYRKPIVTAIEAAGTFWPAENYHQQFYQKNPERYQRIKRIRQQYLMFQRLHGKVRSELMHFRKKRVHK